VIAPASTGKERSRRIAVIITDHENSGIWSNLIFLIRILIMVVIKLIAPKIEEIPAMCKEKIDRSTEAPVWARTEERGG